MTGAVPVISVGDRFDAVAPAWQEFLELREAPFRELD